MLKGETILNLFKSTTSKIHKHQTPGMVCYVHEKSSSSSKHQLFAVRSCASLSFLVTNWVMNLSLAFLLRFSLYGIRSVYFQLKSKSLPTVCLFTGSHPKWWRRVCLTKNSCLKGGLSPLMV